MGALSDPLLAAAGGSVLVLVVVGVLWSAFPRARPVILAVGSALLAAIGIGAWLRRREQRAEERGRLYQAAEDEARARAAADETTAELDRELGRIEAEAAARIAEEKARAAEARRRPITRADVDAAITRPIPGEEEDGA